MFLLNKDWRRIIDRFVYEKNKYYKRYKTIWINNDYILNSHVIRYGLFHLEVYFK